jgi:hypothetical protein
MGPIPVVIASISSSRFFTCSINNWIVLATGDDILHTMLQQLQLFTIYHQ